VLLLSSALSSPVLAQEPLETRVQRLETLLQGVIDRLDK